MLKILPSPLRILFAAVLLNYLAQIPYNLHLYGVSLNPRGMLLLGATFLWFLVGMFLFVQRNPFGYWLTLSFVAVQVLFYFNNEIVLAFFGYGLPYHLTHIGDPVVWTTIMIGALNSIAAAYALFYLLKHRVELLSEMTKSALTRT